MTETRPIAAALSIVTAMAVIGFIDNFVVVIAEDGGIWQFHFLRSLMAVPVFALLAMTALGPIRPRRWGRVAGRSALLTVAMVSYFAALAVLPIAQAVAGLFTAPIFVVLVETLGFRRRIGPVRIGAVAAGFLGILLVLRPDAGAFTPWTVVPVIGGLFYALSAIATRTWCAGESALSLLAGSFTGLGLAGALGLTLFALAPGLADPTGASFVLRGWADPSPRFLFWTLIQSLGSLLAVWFIIRGYQLGETSYVAVFEYTLLVFVSVWAYVLRGEVVDPVAALGIALIVAAGVVIAFRSRDEAVPAPGGRAPPGA